MPRLRKKGALTPGGTSIADMMAQVKSSYGDDSVLLGSEAAPIGAFTTGIWPLDFGLFGGQGISYGTQIYCHGGEGVGKTSLAMMLAKRAQDLFPEKYVAFILSEGRWDPATVQQFGLDPKRLIIHRSKTLERTLDLLYTLYTVPGTHDPNDAIAFSMIDSVAGMLPQEELTMSMEDDIRGTATSKKLSQFFRKESKVVGNSVVWWNNQLRDNQSAMSRGGSKPPSGRAIAFYASVVLSLARVENISRGDAEKKEVIGWRVQLETRKNSTGRGTPFQKAHYNVLRGLGPGGSMGLDNDGAILGGATLYGVIRKSGAFYYYGAEKLGQGEKNARTWLTEHPEECQQIAAATIEARYGEDAVPAVAPDVEEEIGEFAGTLLETDEEPALAGAAA